LALSLSWPKFLGTFKDYLPSQRPSCFSIDQLVEKMERSFSAQRKSRKLKPFILHPSSFSLFSPLTTQPSGSP